MQCIGGLGAWELKILFSIGPIEQRMVSFETLCYLINLLKANNFSV